MANDDHVVAGFKNKFQALMTNILPDPALAKLHRDMAQPNAEKEAASSSPARPDRRPGPRATHVARGLCSCHQPCAPAARWYKPALPSRAWRNGRRAGFRYQYREMWGFESLRPHHCARHTERPTMRIAETLNEGLKREYSVSIPAADLDAKVDAQLGKVAPQVRMPGFRPGKVPLNLVRKMHGAQMLNEALQEAVQEGMQQLIADHKLRPAMQPQIDLAAPPAPGKDVDFKVAVEVLPVDRGAADRRHRARKAGRRSRRRGGRRGGRAARRSGEELHARSRRPCRGDRRFGC